MSAKIGVMRTRHNVALLKQNKVCELFIYCRLIHVHVLILFLFKIIKNKYTHLYTIGYPWVCFSVCFPFPQFVAKCEPVNELTNRG